MPGQPPGLTVQAILKTLLHETEATLGELTSLTGISRFKLSSALTRMKKKTKILPQRVFIIRWTYSDDSGGRNYLKPVYALGDSPNAKKPPPKTNAQCKATYNAKEKLRVNSVFMWGQSRKTRFAIRRGEKNLP